MNRGFGDRNSLELENSNLAQSNRYARVGMSINMGWDIDPHICVCVCHYSLLWHHNGCDGVSNRQPYHCLLKRLFWHRSKKISKLRVIGLCVGNSPVTGEFPAQMASNSENVSIWWRHHVIHCTGLDFVDDGITDFREFLTMKSQEESRKLRQLF